MRFLSIGILVLALVVTACGSKQAPSPTSAPLATATATAAVTPTAGGTTPSGQVKRWSSPPAVEIDVSKTYFATFDTDLGAFKLQLFPKEAPNTVNNFVFLARQGFYDGTVFHRIIKGFMIQGGDPLGNGTGGPGYKFKDELPVKHSYEPGIVAMANSGRDTQGSQFFICNGPDCKGLDSQPNYTQFGRVVEGMDVVQKLSSVEVVMSGTDSVPSKPKVPPRILKVTILEQ